VSPAFNEKLEKFLIDYKAYYQQAYNRAVAQRESLIFTLESKPGESYNLNDIKNRYYNESLADLVKNISEKNRIIEFNGELIQQINPVFIDPKPKHILDYRAHFFAPEKYLFGQYIGTFGFNLMVIWIMTLLLYVTLYFEWLRKFISLFDRSTRELKTTKPNSGKKE